MRNISFQIVSRRQLFVYCLLRSAALQSTSPVDELTPGFKLLKGMFRCAILTALRMNLIFFLYSLFLWSYKRAFSGPNGLSVQFVVPYNYFLDKICRALILNRDQAYDFIMSYDPQ